MVAISPNRKPTTGATQSGVWKHIGKAAVHVGTAITVLVGASSRSWSESAPAIQRNDQSNGVAVQSSANEPGSRQSAIYFVAKAEKAVQPKAEPAEAPPTAAGKPSFVPPLSIADYQNYITSHWSSLLERARPVTLPASPQSAAQLPTPVTAAAPSRNLEPIASVEPWNPPSQHQVESPREIAFAERPAPAVNPPHVKSPPRITISTDIVPAQSPAFDHQVAVADAYPQIEETIRVKAQAVDSFQSTSRSLVVSAPFDNSSNAIAQSTPQAPVATENYLAPSPADEPEAPVAAQAPEGPKYQPVPTTGESILAPSPADEPEVTIVAQAPAPPKSQPATIPPPAEPSVEPAPPRQESMPMQAGDGPPMPMTNSSYLPANPDSYCFRCGVKCPPCGCNPGGPGWAATRPIPWEVFAQGEYVGPSRLAHVPVYRLRVDDQLAFVYRLSGQVAGQPYRLNVRDRIQVQSLSAPEVVNREVIVEPDGTITLPLLGQVRAAGATLAELSKNLDDLFTRQIKDPRITVTPLEMNSNLQELRSSVDRRYGAGGQVSDARISPDGTVQLPAIGSVPAQGLTLGELEREIKARYGQIVEGLEVTPILTTRAPRFVYVVGEVRLPGRYTLEGPTTLMQAIALAGSWNVGAQLNHVVVFRRDENWQLMATRVNIRSSLLFKKPCPEGEIWLRDSDVVLIPKSPILCADDVISLVFTRGIYGVFPLNATINFAKLSSL